MTSIYSNGSNGQNGVERRKSSRRTSSERRKEIRWEPKKPNRRQNGGRRATDNLGVNGLKR